MGDMLLYEEHYEPPRVPSGASERGLLGVGLYLAAPWEGGIMPVFFESVVSPEQQELFWQGCSEWTSFTNVRCIPYAGHRKYARVTASIGATGVCGIAGVGAPAYEFTVISISCWNRRTVLHEIGHALGLFHEHQRPDRDDYIIFDEACLGTGSDGHGIREREMTSRIAGDYDFDSVMHYPPFASARSTSCPTLRARPEYVEQAKNMGSDKVSPLDRAALASIYNLTPPARTGASAPPRFERADFLSAMLSLDAVYHGELSRQDGLSINGGPDFLGIASWIFDVYLASRASGYTQGESFYNVRAWISQSEEWTTKNPGRPAMPILPTNSPIRLDRGEYLNAMHRLDAAYRTELLRPNGLSIGGTPDFLGIAAWIFDVYLNARLSGASPDHAWNSVLAAIRASDEYRQKH